MCGISAQVFAWVLPCCFGFGLRGRQGRRSEWSCWGWQWPRSSDSPVSVSLQSQFGHCFLFLKTTKWEEFYNSRSSLPTMIKEAKQKRVRFHILNDSKDLQVKANDLNPTCRTSTWKRTIHPLPPPLEMHDKLQEKYLTRLPKIKQRKLK